MYSTPWNGVERNAGVGVYPYTRHKTGKYIFWVTLAQDSLVVTSGSRWPSDQLQGFSSYLASYWQHVTLDVVNIWLCPLNLWHLGRNQTIFYKFQIDSFIH